MPTQRVVNTVNTVNIRPGVSVLSVLRHLNYRPWFAIAEFVDNSIQSFLTRKIRGVFRFRYRHKSPRMVQVQC